MNKLQQMMYNAGERLVPYVSHDAAELERHRSSYAFFHAVIAADCASHPLKHSPLTVSDLGFGSGYGVALLSSLPDSHITGVDIGPECETFARQYYARSNVSYVLQDLATYIPSAEPLDYVVSRGVLEHVPDGLNLIKHITFNRRVMVDVPYDEAPGNEHHVLTGITEETFAGLGEAEFFYEDLEGRIFDIATKPSKSNMIMVVLSAPDLPKVGSLFTFPIEPVRDTKLEEASGMTARGMRHNFETPIELLTAIEKAVRETEVVLDIGCGIMPINYFRPKLHLMVEPWKEYSDILSYRHHGDKSVVILRTGGLEALQMLADNSVDSIFLLDVIEHLEKEIGQQIIIECERVAREQVVIFTPYGFMPQHVAHGQKDGWGLGGASMQEHRSGWEPEDFSDAWTFYVCDKFHTHDFKNDPLEQAYGAFYAVRNFDNKMIFAPQTMSEIRKQLPSEALAEQLHAENAVLKNQVASLAEQYQALWNSRGMRIIRMVKKIIRRA